MKIMRCIKLRSSLTYKVITSWTLLLLAHSSFATSPNSAELVNKVDSLYSGSLFDQLYFNDTGPKRIHEIPYPFTALVDSLEGLLGVSVNGDKNKVSTVLIPVGRCINREAAAPEFFKYPRIVIGADTENQGSEIQNLPLLKDRLFIGYQEKAQALEVISYNKQKGRFEFQVVSNYAKDSQPVVKNVDSDQCTGCHQNQGPIFSRSPWDETDSSTDIFTMLSERLGNHNAPGIPNRSRGAVAMDSSTNRANLFKIYQEFWRGACSGQSSHDQIRCRASLFELILIQRFQERSRTLSLSQRMHQYLLPSFTKNIKAQWPDGISVLSSDIPNENPLANGYRAHFELAKELYYPRSLMTKWQPTDLLRMVKGLGDFISVNKMRALDNRLHSLALKSNASDVTLSGGCDIRRVGDQKSALEDNQLMDISVRCDIGTNDFEKEYYFLGNFQVNHRKIETLPVFNRLVLDTATSIMSLAHQGGEVVVQDLEWLIDLKLYDSKHHFHARLPGDGIIDGIEIRWPRTKGTSEILGLGEVVKGSANLTIVDDYTLLDSAISNLISVTESEGLDYFSDKPFRGEMMVDALIGVLNEPERYPYN